MPKVGFFRSIHLKFVLVYVLLILIAIQIIGLYFAKELEQTMNTNFTTSISDRMNLVEFSVREEMLKERLEGDPSLEESLWTVLSGFSSEDIHEIRVINSHNRILASSFLDNQVMVGQRSMDDVVRRSIISGLADESINLDKQARERIKVNVNPIKVGDEVIGALYIESNIEKIYSQMDEINRILAGATAVALIITVILGAYIAQTMTRPIIDMRHRAQEMAKGNFSRKVHVYGNDEMG